jgi:hemerythrin superfamily protein
LRILASFRLELTPEMIMAKKQARKSTKRSTGTSARLDAIKLLKMDHETVQKLFKEFEKTDNNRRKKEIAETICAELTAHATVEEEIFYPAAREALEEGDLMDEAVVEHASAKELIAQIEAGSPGDELWDAKVMVLGEYIEHHVKEEEKEMFPKVKKSDIDLKALAEQMQARKAELQSAPQPRKSVRTSDARSARAH